MNWIEIITLRSSGYVQESLIRELLKTVGEDKEKDGLISMKIYRNVWVDTDMSFYLHWKSAEVGQQGSPLGFRLAQTLKELGLVNHSAWVEEPSFLEK